MKERKKVAIKETLVTVFTGLIINWPISLGFLYLCIDILDLSTLMTSIVITIGMTVVALLRVFTIRMHYSKDD
jgi:Na+-transporting NADH:ubiquinone oxidoreductase subunit NqrD